MMYVAEEDNQSHKMLARKHCYQRCIMHWDEYWPHLVAAEDPLGERVLKLHCCREQA